MPRDQRAHARVADRMAGAVAYVGRAVRERVQRTAIERDVAFLERDIGDDTERRPTRNMVGERAGAVQDERRKSGTGRPVSAATRAISARKGKVTSANRLPSIN